MKYTQLITTAALLLSATTINTMAQTEREEIDEKYKWNVYDLYSNDTEWNKSKDKIANEAKQIATYKGKLAESAQTLLQFFEFSSQISKQMSRLYIYASLQKDQDLRVAENISRLKELENLSTEISQLSAFVDPELAAISDALFDKYMEQEPKLKQVYGMRIDRIKRNKPHTLSPAEEELMAKLSILGNVPGDTYDVFSDAEMPSPRITLSNGEEVELDQATYTQVRASANRDDRRKAFFAFWENYSRFEGTFGELMNGNIREGLFYSKVYKYNSALEAALYHNNIPISVYQSLIDNVNRNLPTFHRYLKLKQKLMNLDQLTYYDLYAPAVEGIELKYTYEEAQQLVLEAIKPLGTEYANVVQRAFNERWIDVYPNKGKASGAYSNGAAYDVHPYILTNYNDSYNSVGTLIHELGHTMHSYFSNKTQPYPTSRYAIFVAEVASTFNEALLDNLMLSKLKTNKEKISLLMSMLDGFKGTLFRQTQFAEFELRMHQMAENNEPITGKALTQLYSQIVKKYYGDEQGICHVDDVVGIEWAFIPHFYSSFYVYQYSTSFVASQALVQKVLSGGEAERNRYLDFISAGGSKYPIEILKDAGVDMTTSDPFDNAIKRMNLLMDEIEKLL